MHGNVTVKMVRLQVTLARITSQNNGFVFMLGQFAMLECNENPCKKKPIFFPAKKNDQRKLLFGRGKNGLLPQGCNGKPEELHIILPKYLS